MNERVPIIFSKKEGIDEVFDFGTLVF